MHGGEGATRVLGAAVIHRLGGEQVDALVQCLGVEQWKGGGLQLGLLENTVLGGRRRGVGGSGAGLPPSSSSPPVFPHGPPHLSCNQFPA